MANFLWEVRRSSEEIENRISCVQFYTLIELPYIGKVNKSYSLDIFWCCCDCTIIPVKKIITAAFPGKNLYDRVDDMQI